MPLDVPERLAVVPGGQVIQDGAPPFSSIPSQYAPPKITSRPLQPPPLFSLGSRFKLQGPVAKRLGPGWLSTRQPLRASSFDLVGLTEPLISAERGAPRPSLRCYHSSAPSAFQCWCWTHPADYEHEWSSSNFRSRRNLRRQHESPQRYCNTFTIRPLPYAPRLRSDGDA